METLSTIAVVGIAASISMGRYNLSVERPRWDAAEDTLSAIDAKDRLRLGRRRHIGGRRVKGFSLIEVLAAVLIIGLVMLGTATTITSAARMGAKTNGPDFVEAAGCAQEIAEAYRNNVAADDTYLTARAATWQNAGAFSTCPRAGTDSIFFEFGRPPVAPTIATCLVQKDCDTAPGNDCQEMIVKVCWNGKNCPVLGTPCP